MRSMKGCAPYLVMTVVQFAYAVSNILCKIAIDRGMSFFVFVAYRHMIAMLILGPLAYIFERKHRPSLTFAIAMKIFFLALFGATVYQILYYAGLNYTSPTVACALGNLIPALTFLMAVLLRMEKLNIRSIPSMAKLFGTMICICGALIFTFWKGFLFKGLTSRPFISLHHRVSSVGSKQGRDDWFKGAALIASSYIAWSSWLILQAIVGKAYPAKISTTALTCFFATLQSSVIALVFDRRITSWRLDWNVQLLSIVYCGIVISAGMYYLQTWCISRKGPVFVSSFSPLVLVIVGLFSAFLFAERLHLGSIIGAFIIVVGLYLVLWGKSKDGDLVQKKGRSDEEASDHQTIKA